MVKPIPIEVECLKHGVHLKTYLLGIGETLDGMIQGPADEELRADAKTLLTTDRLAFPPYEGISFNIKWPL